MLKLSIIVKISEEENKIQLRKLPASSCVEESKLDMGIGLSVSACLGVRVYLQI